MSTFIVTAESTFQQKALKAFLKALEIPYKTKKEESPYDPAFVAKIEQGRKDIAEGKGIVMTLEEIEALCR